MRRKYVKSKRIMPIILNIRRHLGKKDKVISQNIDQKDK